LNEFGFTDVVASLLLPDDGVEEIDDFLVGGAVAEQGTQIMLVEAEKARPDFAVSRESESVAVTAKRLSHGGDDPNFAASIAHGPTAGGFGGIDRCERFVNKILEAVENLRGRNNHLAVPATPGIERHEFNKAQHERAILCKSGESLDFVIVDAADDDGIDFDWMKTQFAGGIDAFKSGKEAVTSRDPLEVFAIEGIETEGDAAKASLAEGLGPRGEEKAVAGHGKITDAGDGSDAGDELVEIAAQERFPAGETDFIDAEAGGEADGALDFVEGEKLVVGLPTMSQSRGGLNRAHAALIEIGGGIGFRQAIETAEIAAVGHADAKVAQDAAVRVGQLAGMFMHGRTPY
jgi:hypothetical protein